MPRHGCFEAYFTLALISLEFFVKNLKLNSNQHFSNNTEYQDIFQEVMQLFRFFWATPYIFLARSSLTSSHLLSLYFTILSKCTKHTSKSSSLLLLFLWLASICYYLPFTSPSPYVIEEILLIFFINSSVASSWGCAHINGEDTPMI